MTIFIVADRVAEARSWQIALRESAAYPEATFLPVTSASTLQGRRFVHGDEVHIVRWPTNTQVAQDVRKELERMACRSGHVQGAILCDIGHLPTSWTTFRFRVIVYDLPPSLDREAVEEWLG